MAAIRKWFGSSGQGARGIRAMLGGKRLGGKGFGGNALTR
jgi:hypothetical protein